MTQYKIFDNKYIKDFITLDNKNTPCYIYDTNLLKDTFDAASKALNKHFNNAHIHYAIKANTHPRIITLAKEYGMGIDCVSGGEILQALDNEITSNNIVFAGVGKTNQEIDIALDKDIFSFNCESIQEIEVINKRAKDKNKIASICIRINPNIDAKTHHYISTGQFDDKFGVSFLTTTEFLQTQLEKLKNIKFIGLHYHVGSQILDKTVFESLANTVNEHFEILLNLGIKVEHINFGGGLGIDYINPSKNPIVDFDNYFETFSKGFKFKNNVQIHFELGRSLVAQSGIIVSSVLFNKTTHLTNFLIIDAGMTELIRPALYQAKHHVESLSMDKNIKKYHVVGPICESSDILAKNIELPETNRNDLIVIYSTGAYAKVLSSQYNLRPSAPEYFI